MLKRYALSLALGTFTIVSIGAYYVHGMTDRPPAFRIATAEGDPAEAAELELSGSFIGWRGSSPVVVTTGGSEYLAERSLYRREVSAARQWFMRNDDIREMIREHRGFMRGKGLESGFYRDEETIVYASAAIDGNAVRPNVTVRIDRLDISSGRTASYATPVVLPERYGYGSVADVQRVGNELHVLLHISGSVTDGPDTVIRDYVFDVFDGSLIREVALDPGIIPAEGTVQRINVVTERLPSDPEPFAVLRVSEEEINKRYAGGGFSVKTRSVRYRIYDYRTGELREGADFTAGGNSDAGTDAPARTVRWFEDGRNDALTNGVLVRLAIDEKERLVVSSEVLETGVTAYTVLEDAPFDVDTQISVRFKEERLLVLYQDAVSSAAIYGLPDGNLLYRGEVAPGGNATAEDAQQLRLLNIEAW